MKQSVKPSLFGIEHSNRDFTDKDSWGKNQFNSSFPTALVAYLAHENLESVYLKLDENLEIVHDLIAAENLFGLPPNSENLFYAFEAQFLPFQKFLTGNIPRVDLVTQNSADGASLKGLEIKLTALPDNSTCHLAEEYFGCEIVVRPDTIVYAACSLFAFFDDRREDLSRIIGDGFEEISDWTEPGAIIPYLGEMFRVIDEVSLAVNGFQSPLVIQPIWKTVGKSPKLAENCLDVFVWSELAFIRLFAQIAKKEVREHKITRQLRTLIWLFKMLYDFSKEGKVNYLRIIDSLSYNTKNDKAFALSGRVTHQFMKGEILLEPRIKKEEIRNIILGGGQNLLSPERRFDAIIFNSSDLF
ncbi:MAG: HindVP family restriction endonuclease [Pyrinomonadaceae bacterium]|nr:HindVP family restriction endonuclease [Pyrinomonadaceae bacterium]